MTRPKGATGSPLAPVSGLLTKAVIRVHANRLMTELARKLRVVDYFTLGWGTMVGAGWLVGMDDWLLRGGALGGVLGFAIGGALLLPIGYVYGQLVMAMPDAAGEVAYTAPAFYSERFWLCAAGHADRSLLHDRLRIGGQGSRRAQPGIPRTWLLHSNLDGNCCGDSLLHHRDCGGGVRRPLEKMDG